MRHPVSSIVFLGVIVLGASLAFSQRGGEQGQGVLSVLSKGQAVSLKDIGGRYEIGVFAEGPQILGYTVMQVGNDYVVLQDIVKVIELRIPIYSVKAVSILSTKGQG